MESWNMSAMSVIVVSMIVNFEQHRACCGVLRFIARSTRRLGDRSHGAPHRCRWSRWARRFSKDSGPKKEGNSHRQRYDDYDENWIVKISPLTSHGSMDPWTSSAQSASLHGSQHDEASSPHGRANGSSCGPPWSTGRSEESQEHRRTAARWVEILMGPV